MKHLLFVDDEVSVLEGIRAMLRRRRSEWEMDFVESGAAALEALEKHSYDLICSDLRMPTMDGAQLLAIASERWPQTVRIVLSGYSQEAHTIRLVPIAHQYLSKPCAAEQFDSVLSRCLDVQELLARPALRALVGRVKKLPSVPKVYSMLREAMAQPNVATSEIAKIIGADTAIVAKLLQVVNSSFFRLARRIFKVEQAVAYLGLATVRNLVLSVEVFSQWTSAAARSGCNLEHLQSQSLLVAAVARALAEGTAMADDALVAGLVHDIGYLVLAAECPEELRRARKLSSDEETPLFLAERAIIGASHAEVGAYLLALWGFPYPVVEAVAHHHEPNVVAPAEFDLVGLLAVATALAGEPGTDGVTIDAAHLQSIHAPFTLSHAQECVRVIKSADNAAGDQQ